LSKVEAFKDASKITDGYELSEVIWTKSLNCETWLMRRTNYAQSLAVMSVVGYILGLGDRHPNNLMMDRQNGKYTPRCIAMLTVLNTASIQLLPTTIGSLRAAHGAKSPLDISVPILFVSLVSAAAGCAVVYVLSLGRKNT